MILNWAREHSASSARRRTHHLSRRQRQRHRAFVIVLRELDLPIAMELAERGMNAIRNLEALFGEMADPIRLTASMGIARLRQGETAASWIERADRTLYQAKNAGRDRIEVDPMDLADA